jgi:hypothetical protein
VLVGSPGENGFEPLSAPSTLIAIASAAAEVVNGIPYSVSMSDDFARKATSCDDSLGKPQYSELSQLRW